MFEVVMHIVLVYLLIEFCILVIKSASRANYLNQQYKRLSEKENCRTKLHQYLRRTHEA